MATLTGTLSADTMLGSAGDDVFHASAGNDKIWGGTGGFDTLFLTGQFSDYTIRDNGDGSYTITDLRASGDGVDIVRAIDSFVFSDRTMSMADFAAQGSTLVTGTDGADNQVGTARNDTFSSSAGNDAIWGGTGGTDTIVYSGTSNDYDIRVNDDGSYTITDRRGVDGVDKVRDIDQFRFADGTLDLADFLAARPNHVYGTAGDDTQVGTAGNDVLHASAGNDRIWGGIGGTDTLAMTGNLADYAIRDNGDGSFTVRDLRTVGDGVDLVRGIDSFAFQDMTLSLEDFLAHGANLIEGPSGDNIWGGTSRNDHFISGVGNDNIWGGNGGFDTVAYSGAFDDYDIRANDDGSYTITDRRGIDGVDKVRDIDLFSFSDEAIDLEGFLALRPVNLYGTSGDDVARGTMANDHFFSSAGNDHYWGIGQGDDLLTYSGKFADYVIVDRRDGSYTVIDMRDGSPDGTDVVRGVGTFEFADRTATLSEILAAHPSGFILNGIGTAGDDILHGSDGDDVLQGFGGRDRIWGGKDGNDTVVFTGNFADYVITDNDNGAFTVTDIRDGRPDGIAVVRDVETYQFADVSLHVEEILTASQALVTTLNGTVAADTMSGAHTMGLYDAHTNDLIVAGAGDDFTRGGPGHDFVIGDEGAAAGSKSGSVTTISPTTSSTLPTFTDDTAFYQVRTGQLYQVNPLTGESTAIGVDHHNYDAVGINPVDGYAYAVGHSGPWATHVLRIGSDGNVESLGVGFQPVKSGGFAADGTLYLRTGTNEMTMVDVATLTQTELQFGGETPAAVNDIVFIPNAANGTFYGVTVNGTLVAYDLTSLTVTTASIQGALVAGGPYGSGWAGEDGGLYFAHNRTGNIYAISGLENMRPTAALLSVGGTTNSGDGFSLGSVVLPQELLGDGSDWLLGGAGNDHLVGGIGRDFLDGGTGADILDGGVDIDTADYSRAVEAVTANLALGGIAGEAAGDVYISMENLLGSSYGDTLIGDGQDNEITGGAGDDALYGGGGNDVLRGEVGADLLDGGDGFDIATYYDAAAGVAVDLAAGVGTAGEAAGDTLFGIEAVQGSSVGGDILLGSESEDLLQGFGGDDVLDGREGNDALHGGDGADVVYGGGGNDLLLGQDGDDWLDGSDGDDNLQGGNGADTLLGGAGVDRLWGAAGGDILQGGAGDDFLRGGEGADVFALSNNDGDDTILDFMTGLDRIDLSGIAGLSGFSDLAVTLIEPGSSKSARVFDVAYSDGAARAHLTVQLDTTLWGSNAMLTESDFHF